MSWYRRPLAEGQTFRCSSCGRIKRVKYVPTSTLCRSCAAKKRRTVPNVPVSIVDNLVVTTIVKKRLHNRAEKDIPRPKIEMTAHKGEQWFWIFLALSFYPVVIWLGFLGLVLYAGLIILFYLAIKGILAKPLMERDRQVDLRTRELAEERKRRQEEEQLFYSSPEWSRLRDLVIKEEGRVCAECHVHIKKDIDVTVDHIRPRSKYPDLALRRDNLRVLCRECNSRKKDTELVSL